MTLNLKFDINECGSLKEILCGGIVGYATEKLWGNKLSIIWLYLNNHMNLKIHTKMTDVEEWTEVGTLVFNCNSKIEGTRQIIDLPDAWMDIVKINKMKIIDEKFIAESGLQITNRLNENLIIVASENPFQIEMKSSFFKGSFSPEYDFPQYKLEDL